MPQQIPAPQPETETGEAPAGRKGVGRMFVDAPLPYKLAYMATAAMVVGGMIVLMLWINRPQYQVLYSGLSQQDASAVVAKLQEMKAPYKLEGGGGTITVPSEQVYDVRLAMAGAGLPRGAGVGFEVFNEVKMGTTEFVQKINYQRALQGELARTITGFTEVDKARVHIVMPRDSLFVEEEKKPSAGVVVDLAAGRRLSASQVAGIVHLVASAVPDLTDDRVTIVDTAGNLIYRKAVDNGDFPGALTAAQLEYQRNVENALKAKAQSMLEQMLGPGKAVVRVSTDIDFTRTSSNQESFDPDGVVVRSETRSTESAKDGSQSPQGSPDQRFALAARNATPPQAGQDGSGQSSRENETTNFEISRTRTQTVKSVGGLKRLSVAVVVDGPYKTGTGADGQTTRTFEPRSAQQMRQLEEIVASAVGYNEARGDKVSVINTPFYLAGDADMVSVPWWEEYLNKYGRMGLNLILALLFFLLVVRPLLRYLMTILPQPAPAPAELPAGMAPAALTEGEAEEEEERLHKPNLIEQIAELTRSDPDRATAVLRAWIHETE